MTTFQRGFPLVIGNGESSDAALFGAHPRPDAVAGCEKTFRSAPIARLDGWFNTACFAAPANFTFGSEPRVDSSLRSDGVNNFDFAVFKKLGFGPDGRGGFETRVEFFNLFNHTQFGPPNTICCTANNANFGFVTSTAPGTNPRLVQFAMKVSF